MGLVARIIILTAFDSSKAQPPSHGGHFDLIVYPVQLVDIGKCNKIEYFKRSPG